jgi:peptidoglycan/xylan/chitin deacetylase (PgdA/CDA1 family)
MLTCMDIWARLRRFEFLGEFVRRVDTDERVVALTFDDGPNPPYTNQILDVLDCYRIRATFFVVGRNVERHPETARLVLAKGHELGNHSYSHTRMVFKLPSFVRSEVERTDHLLSELGVTWETHFRPPYGRKILILPYIIARMHKKNIMWDVDSTDYEVFDPETIVKRVLGCVRPGSIILLHDGEGDHSHTVTAIGMLIEDLRRKGYEFRTVSELINQTESRSEPQVVQSA